MPNPRNEGAGGGSTFSAIRVVRNGRWDCNVCGITGNWATRPRCRNCTAYGPRGSGGGGKGGGWAPAGGGGGGGQGFRNFGGHQSHVGGARPGGGTGGAPTNYAQRQLQRQYDDQRLQKQRDEAKKREETLRAANQKLQRELAAAKAGSKSRDDDEDMDEEDEQEAEEERQRKIDATQKAIPYLILQFGDESEQVCRAKGEIEDLQRASRDAKPYKTHRGQLERRLERLQRQQEKAREEEDEILIEVERVQDKLNKLRNTIAERAKTINAVDEELKDLLRKAISESEASEQPPTPPAVDPNAAWQTINATLATMAAQPGVPAGWAEQLGGLLEQVRMAAVALTQHAVATTPSQAMQQQQQQQQQQAPTNQGAGGGGANGAASSSSSSPSPPSLPTPAPANAAQPPAPATVDQNLRESPASQAANRWASRVHDLAFADGGGAGGGEQPAENLPNGAIEGAATNQAAASGGQKLVGTDSDSDLESDDDMASVVGADFERQEDESIQQHSVARMLKVRVRTCDVAGLGMTDQPRPKALNTAARDQCSSSQVDPQLLVE